MLEQSFFYQLFAPLQDSIDNVQNQIEQAGISGEKQEQVQQELLTLFRVARFIGMPELADLFAGVKHYYQLFTDRAENEEDFSHLGHALYDSKRYLNYVLSRQRNLPQLLIPAINAIHKLIDKPSVSIDNYFSYDKPENNASYQRKRQASQDVIDKQRTMFSRFSHLYNLSLKAYCADEYMNKAILNMSLSMAYLAKMHQNTALFQLFNSAKVALRCAGLNIHSDRTKIKSALKALQAWLQAVNTAPVSEVQALEEVALNKLTRIIAQTDTTLGSIQTFKQQHNIAQYSYSEAFLAKELAVFDKPDGGILNSATEMIGDELTLLRNHIDVCVRQDDIDEDAARMILSQMDDLGKTLNLLGMQGDAGRLNQVVAAFDGKSVSKVDMEGILTEVVRLDDALKTHLKETDAYHLPELVSFVAGITDLDDAKKDILTTVYDALLKIEAEVEPLLNKMGDKTLNLKRGADFESYDEKWQRISSELIQQVGALRFISLNVVADLIEMASDVINNQASNSYLFPAQKVEDLVNAIASAEYVIHSYLDKKPINEAEIHKTHERMTA